MCFIVTNMLYSLQSVAGQDKYLPSDEIWVCDLEEVFQMAGEVPPSMSGTCGCSLNGHMYIFGGYDKIGQSNQIFCVNLTDGKYTWRSIKHKIGSAPSHRDKLSCWIHKGSYLVLFFFQLEDVVWGWNNEVHVFDPVHASWSEPQTHGRTPTPRATQASATLGCRGYICGGRVMGTRMSDIHCLDLESWTWSEIIPVSTTPVGRSWHTLTAVSDSSLFLFGGLNVDCKPMNDGWLFDVQTKKWREHPFKTKPRLWHTACLGKDSDVIVFGGSCDYIFNILTGHCNDALIFQMQPYSLYRICENYIAKNVKNCEVLRHQLLLLPPKLVTAVQRRMSLYRRNSIS
uniref:Kelch domain-containing protein 1 n=1 Tax=Dicentrarchus labrax TaxID=13489 RepID=A0A8P4GAQ8_DICLA